MKAGVCAGACPWFVRQGLTRLSNTRGLPGVCVRPVVTATALAPQVTLTKLTVYVHSLISDAGHHCAGALALE